MLVWYFNPRTPCGVRLSPAEAAPFQPAISIHAPLAGCDIFSQLVSPCSFISIHAPLAGCDVSSVMPCNASMNFNPRTPCGVRRTHPRTARARNRFQSTHPLRGATRLIPPLFIRLFISIHAPLAGCDRRKNDVQRPVVHFNPRTPCGVRPKAPAAIAKQREISIHAPLAGCDTNAKNGFIGCFDFNPRTPCGVRHNQRPTDFCDFRISIHAPLAGCDGSVQSPTLQGKLFQSTHPLRGATTYYTIKDGEIVISIHAPLAGCDPKTVQDDTSLAIYQSTHPLRGATASGSSNSAARTHFNPRTPCGVRLYMPELLRCACDFNPRTPCGVRPAFVAVIEIRLNFNPRTPCGVRPRGAGSGIFPKRFQSTHPLRGATARRIGAGVLFQISIHAPLAGCDPLRPCSQRLHGISIHAPLAGCD